MKNLTPVIVALLLMASSVFASASSSTYAVGTCRPSMPSFTIVGAAIAGVPAGATILVCPGTYEESELNITQPLTLEGVTSGDSAMVLIQLNSPMQSVVNVVGTGPVNISNIQFGGQTISGVGIQYLNASGTLNHLTLCSLPATCPLISFLDLEISVTVNDGSSQTVNIENSSFLASNSTPLPAIQTSVSSGALAVTIQGNSIFGGQTGISTQGGPATISGNFISGGGVGIASGGGATISGNTIINTSGPGITSAAGDSITSNKFNGNGTAISATGTGTFTRNTIMNATVGIDMGCNLGVATSNSFINTGTGFNNVLTSFGTATNGFFVVPVVKGTICQ
jgi:hypothetical protein